MPRVAPGGRRPHPQSGPELSGSPRNERTTCDRPGTGPVFPRPVGSSNARRDGLPRLSARLPHGTGHQVTHGEAGLVPYISKEQRAMGAWMPGRVVDVAVHALRPCTYGGCGELGRPFLQGPRCPAHTPAALAGRAEPAPDPGRSAEALRLGGRQIGRPDGQRYGHATDSPRYRGGRQVVDPDRP